MPGQTKTEERYHRSLTVSDTLSTKTTTTKQRRWIVYSGVEESSRGLFAGITPPTYLPTLSTTPAARSAPLSPWLPTRLLLSGSITAGQMAARGPEEDQSSRPRCRARRDGRRPTSRKRRFRIRA